MNEDPLALLQEIAWRNERLVRLVRLRMLQLEHTHAELLGKVEVLATLASGDLLVDVDDFSALIALSALAHEACRQGTEGISTHEKLTD